MAYEPLPDRWHTRDFPVLIEAARLLDSGEPLADADAISEKLGWDEDSVIAALAALTGTYLTGDALNSLGGPIGFYVTGLTERGRRAVGLWPSGESIDALVDALQQAENATDDPEERSALRRAWSAVGGVSRDVMVDVVAAVISRQSGLG